MKACIIGSCLCGNKFGNGCAGCAGLPPRRRVRRGQGGGRGGGALPMLRRLRRQRPTPRMAGSIGGSILPDKPDARGWGWQVKALMNPATPRPLYNKAKELLLQDKVITSYTISSFNPELYCEVRKHFDFIWFEMQHSTMSFDEVRRMLLTCPGADGGAPMIRMPDALDPGLEGDGSWAIGIIVPTVDDALEARDAARSRATRRSAGEARAADPLARSGPVSTTAPRSTTTCLSS